MSWKNAWNPAGRAPAPAAAPERKPAYTGLVDLKLPVWEVKRPWGLGFVPEQVGSARNGDDTPQTRLLEAAKKIPSPTDGYTYMFNKGYDSKTKVHHCVNKYVPLGDFLETAGWAELTSRPGLFKSVKYYKEGLDGPEISEEEAVAISAAWDPEKALEAEDEPEPPPTVQRKRTFSATGASAAGSSAVQGVQARRWAA